MMSVFRGSVARRINRSAAILVGDVRSSEIIVHGDQPSSGRSVCRLLIAVVGLVLLITVTVWWSVLKAPTRQERHWLRDFTGPADAFFKDEDRAEKLFDGRLECPCLTVNRSFELPPASEGYLLEFFTITPRDKENSTFTRGEYPQNGKYAIMSDPFFPDQLCCELLSIPCTTLTKDYCNRLLENFTHYLESTAAPVLLNPRQYLYRTCGDFGRISLDDKSSNTDISMNDTDILALTYVRYSWANVFGNCRILAKGGKMEWGYWPFLTDIQFWQYARRDASYAFEIPTTRGYLSLSELGVGNQSVALSLDFNWELYFQLCGPAYCDEFINNSKLWNLFEALAQVGGFLSLALLLLRIVIWPAIRATFGWIGPDKLDASPPSVVESKSPSFATST